jgi:ATP-dependent Clp protease protease subunit
MKKQKRNGMERKMSETKYPEHKKRYLLLSDRICQNSVKNIMDDILEINEDDRRKEEIYKDWERKPIKLFINSYGGSVYDGLALIDVIKRSKTPVHTICVGSCMSMGLWIWLAGAKRLIGERSTLMFHDLAAFAIDKTEGIKQELNEMLRLQEMLIADITGSSLVKEETLRDYIMRKAEWYIPASEAISLKLASGYYK